MIRPVFAILTSAFFVFLTLPLQVFRIRTNSKNWWSIPSMWHRFMARRFNLEVAMRGEMVTDRPVLWVANHLSWADIFVLGGHCKNASFVAKAEIQTWRFVGWLAGMAHTQYVDRGRRSDSKRQRDRLISSVHQGRNLILFPEGVTTGGNDVLTFKSSLFSVAEQLSEVEHDFLIQPVTISYVEMHGMPIVRARRPQVAWMGTVGMIHHFRQHFKHGPIKVLIEYHDPVHYDDFGSRKAIATYCRDRVQEGLERAHKGHIRELFE